MLRKRITARSAVKRAGVACLIASLLGLVLLSAGYAEDTTELSVPYEVKFQGISKRSLRKQIEQYSNLAAFKKWPPPTIGILKRRAENDVPRLLRALKAQGYYGAKVEFDLDEDKKPVLVTFKTDLGPVYKLESVKIEVEGDEARVRPKLPSIEALKLKLGKPARAAEIVGARQILEAKVQDLGFPFAKAAEPKVVVDHSTKEVEAEFKVETGPLAGFGKTTFSGQKAVEESFLRGKLPWEEGKRYDAALLKEMQKRLVDTKLFSFVSVKPAQKLDKEGRIPILVELKERKSHTISVGASYYTDEGPGGTISWEARNLFHRGERLTIEGKASGIGYEGKVQFEKPEFLRNDQSLIFDLRAARDDNDAFSSNNLQVGPTLEREIRKKMKLSAGPAFRLDHVHNVQGDEDFSLFLFPTQFDWDASDEVLNPTRGGRLKVELSPYVDMLNSNADFFKQYTSYTRYFKFIEDPEMVLAGRAAVGTISGADRDSVPADVRFYAGGGSSVRGYRYLTLSPLLRGKPLGGNSVVELSAELRAKITEKIGAVVFIDGGNAFESSYPDFNSSLRWGAGPGLRYFTPVGPIRVDIAFPLNPRSIDDPFQLYFSIGQAF